MIGAMLNLKRRKYSKLGVWLALASNHSGLKDPEDAAYRSVGQRGELGRISLQIAMRLTYIPRSNWRKQ
jgi:hypothetical protein